ncbi:hypothetical protein [Psychromonas aquatilis]|uniref:Intracellular septation protein A n=1 Tax=Psychromonas aquatilis TaxID=2005072 RepID=A0ABU9GMY1_9GAMM
MSSDIRIILKGFQQFLLLSVLAILPILTLAYDLIYTQHQGISEYSMTEYLQELLLLSTVLVYSYIAYKKTSHRHFAVLLAGFFCCLLIREFDALLDKIQHGFWVYPALLVALSSIIYALKDLSQTLRTFSQFVQHKHFITLNLGMVMLLVFSRIFGMGDLWEGILGEDYDRLVKRVVEEGLEVLGYTIIFYAAIGYLGAFLSKNELTTD